MKFLQETLVQVEKQALKDLLDQRDKKDKKGRGCPESSTCGGAGQVAMEMHRLYTQVKAFEDNKDMTTTENWALGYFCNYGDMDCDLT